MIYDRIYEIVSHKFVLYSAHTEGKKRVELLYNAQWMTKCIVLFYFIFFYFLFFGACTCALRMQLKKSIKIELGPFELEKVNIIFVESPVV